METKNLDWGKRMAEGERQYTLKNMRTYKGKQKKHSTVKAKGNTKWVRGEHHSTDPRTAENAQKKRNKNKGK